MTLGCETSEKASPGILRGIVSLSLRLKTATAQSIAASIAVTAQTSSSRKRLSGE